MLKDIIFAGFGGQGVQFCSKVVANTAMRMGKEISWLPSYGPEMRGGTSNCSVCIDESAIASPLITEPTYLLALNEPSFVKFIDNVKAGGTAVFDSSLVCAQTERKDIEVYGIPATKMAKENRLDGLANMIALGYLIKKTDILPLDEIKGCVNKMSKGKKELEEKNYKALDIGYNY